MNNTLKTLIRNEVQYKVTHKLETTISGLVSLLSYLLLVFTTDLSVLAIATIVALLTVGYNIYKGLYNGMTFVAPYLHYAWFTALYLVVTYLLRLI